MAVASAYNRAAILPTMPFLDSANPRRSLSVRLKCDGLLEFRDGATTQEGLLVNEIVELRIAAPMWLLVTLAAIGGVIALAWLVGVALELRDVYREWRARRQGGVS